MGTCRKRGRTWLAEVRRTKPQFYAAESFPTKAHALAWISRTETELFAGRLGRLPAKPFRDLLDKYSKEVSPTKKGCKWEQLRLALIGRDPIGDVMLSDLGTGDFAAWRDRRLQVVKVGSMLREWTLLRHVVTVAIGEWKWLSENPMKGVRKPPPPPSRDRLATCEEVERILFCLGFEIDRPAVTLSSRAGLAWLLAVETAMRAGELAGLTWGAIDKNLRFAKLSTTKNGKPRDVALSPAALSLLEQLPTDQNVLELTTRQLDSLWRKGVRKAGVVDLHFHDSRHLAITRLSKKLGVLELARMVGHRDIRQLQVYFNESATTTAGKL